MLKNYYEILEVHTHATQQEIEDAYDRLLDKNHPSRKPALTEAQRLLLMKPIILAYSMLSDPDTRREYDRMLTEKHLKDRYDCDRYEAPSKIQSFFDMFGKKRMGFIEAYRQLSKEQRRIVNLIIIILTLNGFIQLLSVYMNHFHS